jgi:hypothetical protein
MKVIPLSVSRTAAAADPYLVWNTFVKLCFLGTEDYTPAQRIAHLAFLYDAEVQNGGHYQYFENKGLAAARETMLALDRLGARSLMSILEGAVRKYEEINPEEHKVGSPEEFIEGALEGHYEDFDAAYSRCTPTLEEFLKTCLDSHFAEFIVWID